MEPQLAEQLVNSLKGAGIDFVTFLPETRLSQILPLIRDDPALELVPVSSEAEAVTIARRRRARRQAGRHLYGEHRHLRLILQPPDRRQVVRCPSAARGRLPWRGSKISETAFSMPTSASTPFPSSPASASRAASSRTAATWNPRSGKLCGPPTPSVRPSPYSSPGSSPYDPL